MTTYKPVFMRPVEITTANNAFSVKLYITGVGYTQYDKTLDVGVWGSMFEVAAGIAAEVNAITAQYDCTAAFVQSGNDLLIKFTIKDNDNNGFYAEWDWDEVYDLIGSSGYGSFKHNWDTYDTNSSDEYYYTMTYRPSHMWIPTYQIANQDRFQIDQSEIFTGQIARTGVLCGNDNGSRLYFRQLDFVNEQASNLFIEASTNSRLNNRSLEYFADYCRSVTTVTSGNPCAKGFYFVPDWNDITTTCSNKHNDNGGINFDYSASPDEFVFCQMDPRGYLPPNASVPTARGYYRVTFTIYAVDYTVAWTYYS